MRLDQLDGYRTTLDARVVAIDRDDAGVWTSLDRSVFYPTSGGQPHDTGRLVHADGEATVVDVVADGPEAVRHRLEGEIPTVGTEVRAEIDWDRRYRHMQRHSAQHLVSQAFLRVGEGFETRSVSLTSADATLDLAGEPKVDDVEAAFELARAWAYRDLPIEAFEVDEDELSRYDLRRPPKVAGRVRLVRMGDVELAACGGTHLRRTAEMLPLLALSRQRIRGALTRVTFRAGLEAGERASRAVALTDELARSFSARWDELPERVEALRDEGAALRWDAERALADWASLRIAAALGEGRRAGDRPVIRVVTDDAARLGALADAAKVEAPGAITLLAARGDGRATLLFQAGPDVEVDLRPALRAALPAVDGRGGGKPERVQGAGAEVAGVEAALDAAESVLAVAPSVLNGADA